MNRTKETITVAVLGFVAALVLLEASLRVLGAFQVSRAGGRPEKPAGRRVILCVGDSFTYGLGAAPEDSYPRQLERLFEAQNVAVINKGMPGTNTAQMLNRFEQYLNETKPDAVVILAGGANTWNYKGYYAYARENAWYARLFDRIYDVRLYRLIRLLASDVRRRRAEKRDGPDAGRGGTSSAAANARYDAALSYGHTAKYRDSKECWEEIKRLAGEISANPADIENYCKIGTYYQKFGLYDKAMGYYAQALRLAPRDVYILKELGYLHMKSGQPERALRYFEQALRENPREPGIWLGMGRAYSRIGRKDKALKCFEKGIALEPENTGYYFDAGTICRERSDNGTALRYFKKGIEIAPDDEENDNYAALGSLYRACYGRRLNGEIAAFIRQLAKEGRHNNQWLKSLMMIVNGQRDGNFAAVERWIAHDVAEMVRISRRRGIDVVIQSYPANRPVNGILKTAAGRFCVPYVDNAAVFSRLLDRRPRSDLFIPDGHCTGRGYGVMAKNVYDALAGTRVAAGK